MILDDLFAHLITAHGQPIKLDQANSSRWDVRRDGAGGAEGEVAGAQIHICVTRDDHKQTASIWVFDPSAKDGQTAFNIYVDDKENLLEVLAKLDARLPQSDAKGPQSAL